MRTDTPATLYWSKVFDLLVIHCGARNDYETHDAFVDAHVGNCREYRFQGSLGFGGKCYSDDPIPRVGCYSEDRTPHRDSAIATVNAALVALGPAPVGVPQ